MVEIKTPNYNIKNELKGIAFSDINKETDKIFDFKQEHIIRHGFEYSPIDYGNETEESEDYTKSLKKSKKIVEEILSVWDKSRNNDVLLYFEFLRTRFPEIEVTDSRERVIFKFPKKIVKYLNSPDTILRIRRKFNEKGLYLPTSKSVIIRRLKRQKALRKYFVKK